MRSVLEGLLQHPPDLRRVPARQIPEARGGRKLAEVAQQLLASERTPSPVRYGEDGDWAKGPNFLGSFHLL